MTKAGRPNELRVPHKVSADIEDPLYRLIKMCGFKIRTLIERGFEASIPKGMTAWEYALSMKEKDIIQKRRSMDNLYLEFQESKMDHDLAVKQKEMMIKNSLDEIPKESIEDIKKKVFPHAQKILLKFKIMQDTWSGDMAVIPWIEKEFKITMTYDQLYIIYEEMKSHAGLY